MIKRAIVAIFAILALGLCYSLVVNVLSSEGPVEQPKKRQAKKESWSGEGAHIFNTTLYRRDGVIAIDRAEFRGLQLAKATVQVQLRADLSNGRPDWLRPNRFYGYRYAAKKRSRPQVTERVQGTANRIILTFKGVPTGSLGPTCTGPSAPTDPFFLRLPGLPGGEVAIAITAPPAPAGKCLADPKAIAAAERAKLLSTKAVAVRKVKVKGKKVTIQGQVNVNGLSGARIELGRTGNFGRSKQIKAKRGRFQIQMRAPGKGRFRIRATVRDPKAGTFHPKAAAKMIRVR